MVSPRFDIALLTTLVGAFLQSAHASSAPSISNTIYMIRHGEKPSDGGQGLSEQGEERAQCLTNVFGPESQYNIGYIMAEEPQSNGDRTRPLETVTPLAEELGLTVDDTCSRGDESCVTKAVKAFAKTSGQNILICWEHKELNNIAEALGVNNPPSYPDDAYNIIWTIIDQNLVSQTSEDCPGLDD